MKEDLIIIIPTHKRQYKLSKCAWYYSQFNYPVYICDSTPGESKSIVDNENIHYLHVPELGFYEKILRVLEITDAKFYALSPDDDYLKQETLEECVVKMKSNVDYSLAVGKQVFWNEGFVNRKFFYLKSANGFSENPLGDKRKVKFKRFWANYQNILWSLYRKDVLKEAFQMMYEKKYSNQNFIELTLGATALLKGDIYVSNNALNYRELSTSEHWGGKEPEINPLGYIKNKSIRSDCKKFINTLPTWYYMRTLLLYLFFHSRVVSYFRAAKRKISQRSKNEANTDYIDESMSLLINYIQNSNV